jgi:hypothetical protein
MTAGDFAAAFRAMDDPSMQIRADTLGRAIRAESGIETATAFVEKRLITALQTG